MFTLELEALYKHLNGRVKKEAIISKGARNISNVRFIHLRGRVLNVSSYTYLNSSANIPDVSKRTRSEEERAISRRKKSKDKCLIYVKPKEDAIFTPIFLQHKTVKEFKDKLEFKFGAYKFQSTRIGRIYQVGEIRVLCTEKFP